MGARPKLPVSVTTSISSISQRVFTGTAQPAPAHARAKSTWFQVRGRCRECESQASSGSSGGRRVLSLNASFSDIARLLRLLVLSLCTLARSTLPLALVPSAAPAAGCRQPHARSEFETVNHMVPRNAPANPARDGSRRWRGGIGDGFFMLAKIGAVLAPKRVSRSADGLRVLQRVRQRGGPSAPLPGAARVRDRALRPAHPL
jgi:hypothetical protein